MPLKPTSPYKNPPSEEGGIQRRSLSDDVADEAGLATLLHKRVAYIAQHPLFEHLPVLRAHIAPEPPYVAAVAAGVGQGAVAAAARARGVGWGSEVASTSGACSSDIKRDGEAPPPPNAWFGTSGTVTALHFDGFDNLLCQVAGFKYIRLFAPSQSARLYARHSAPHSSQISPLEMTTKEEAAQVAAKFPLLAGCASSELLLGPGETLFIPAGTWHYVRSLTTSLSVNFWF